MSQQEETGGIQLQGTPFGYTQTPGNLSNMLNNSGSFIIPNLQPRDFADNEDVDQGYSTGGRTTFNNT
jgi:hypothetical protein